MSVKARVTICVPTYNSSVTLPATLQSIVGQTFADLRILIVDNASTDETLNVAQEFSLRDKRIEIIRNSENIGGEGNFNKCLTLSGSEYTAIFHADDIYDPDIVRQEVAALDADEGIGLIFSGAAIIDGQDKKIGDWAIPKSVFSRHNGRLDFHKALSLVLRFGNFFMTPSAMARTELWHAVGGFHGASYGTSADLGTWLSMLKRGSAVQILEAPLMKYRSSSHSYTFNLKRRRLAPHDILLVMDEYAMDTKNSLSSASLADHRFYHFKDAVNRAINHIILGEHSVARDLIWANSNRAVLRAAVHSSQQVKLFVIGCAVYLLSYLCRSEDCREWLRQRRFRGA